jgi:putative spermidine/putrescine transport system ATP-binding protein
MGSIIRLRAKVAGETVVMDTFNRADQPPPVAGTAIEISLSGKDAIVLNG